MTAPDTAMDKRGGLLGSALAAWTELKGNRRAAWGLFMIGLLVGLYALLLLSDAVDAIRASYVEAVLRLDRIQGQSAERDWPARAAASGTLRQTLESRLWPAESEGVARANMQDWVTNAGRAAGLDRLQLRLELSHPQALPTDLRQVTATITALPTETSLTNFLALIAQDRHLFVVDRLRVQQRPFASLEMALSSYAKLSAAGASSGRR